MPAVKSKPVVQVYGCLVLLLVICASAGVGVWQSQSLLRLIPADLPFLQIWQVSPHESGVLFRTVLSPGQDHGLFIVATDGQHRSRLEIDLQQVQERLSIDVQGHLLATWHDEPAHGPQYDGPWRQVLGLAGGEEPLELAVSIQKGAFDTPIEIGLSRPSIDQKRLNLQYTIPSEALTLLFLFIGAIAALCVVVLLWGFRAMSHSEPEHSSE